MCRYVSYIKKVSKIGYHALRLSNYTVILISVYGLFTVFHFKTSRSGCTKPKVATTAYFFNFKGNPLSRDRIFRAENCHFTSRTVTILFQSPDGAISLTNRGPNLKSFLQGAIQNCEVLKRFHIPNCWGCKSKTKKPTFRIFSTSLHEERWHHVKLIVSWRLDSKLPVTKYQFSVGKGTH